MSETLSSSTYRLWRRFIFSVIAIALVIGALLLTIQFTGSSRVISTMTGTDFLNLAQRATSEKFVATYLVRGNDSPFIFTGKIMLASDPELLPKNPPENSSGYPGAGEYFAYVFTHSDGSLVQWVQKGAYVSWCLKWPSVNGGKLECTGPGPFEPSNGYAYQLLPFVPTTVLSHVKDFLQGQPRRSPPVVLEDSRSFGSLHCLLQTSGAPHLETCINQDGFIVSSNFKDHGVWSTTTLVSFDRRPTSKDFTTLMKSSGHVPLPPP